LAKWGRDRILSDMVWSIRHYQPDVIILQFSGTPRDGHGQHQASAILGKEAYFAAADPKRFPEQIAQGLLPWQAQKLYIGNVCGFGAMTCDDSKWTIKLNTGEKSADLGESYAQFAMEGLRHQLSQGSGTWTVDPGDRFTFYKLVDLIKPAKLDDKGHEKDFFDGIATSLPALAKGIDESKVPKFEWKLQQGAIRIAKATDAANRNDASAAAIPLLGVAETFKQLGSDVKAAGLSAAAESDLIARLEEKSEEAERALNAALGVTLQATVVSRTDRNGDPVNESAKKEAETITTVSPGQEVLVGVTFHNGSKVKLIVDALKLEVPEGWGTISEKIRRVAINPGGEEHAVFRLQVPKDATFTRPYWHRDNPETESVNHIDNEKYVTLPFPPPVLRARVEYSVAGTDGRHDKNGIDATVEARFLDDGGKERARPLAVVPAFSVALEPGTQVITAHHGASSTVAVGVTSNLNHAERGILRLEVPPGWQTQPAQIPVEFSRRGEKQDFQFKVLGAGLREGRAQVRAVLEAAGQSYREGYTLVTREDLGSFYYYQPAIQRVSIVDVKAPHDLKIGYVMGAGDDIPTVLKQAGLDVTVIAPEKLAEEDLSKYGTIVLGIRAYDTQKDVAANNKRLLDYVFAGGTLVVQYNASVADFNKGNFTPFSAELSRARVSVEEAPVDILAPDDGVFHYPNEIAAKDFDGWVQERGLYFMDKWDEHFEPLLSCHDPGEDAQKGGLLRAQYGKGTYIYTGYAFFRQLPAGVPGAVRLYVNLLSAGHESGR
jgi:hypothetical protein